MDISDICTQIYYLLKNKNYNVKVFQGVEASLKKQNLDIFNMKSRRIIINKL